MMPKKYMAKVGILVSRIREKGELTLGEACLVLQVGPWQVKQYAKTIVDICVDIRFDGSKFHTIILSPPEEHSQVKLDQFGRER